MTVADDYTPTTAEIREYVETGGEPRPWVELDEAEEALERARGEAFDRWLATHDAEVQAQVVAEEPEWEYGWAWADEVDSGTVHGYHTSSTADERAELSKHRSEFIAPVVDMRRKVTPWVPVKQEGARQ